MLRLNRIERCLPEASLPRSMRKKEARPAPIKSPKPKECVQTECGARPPRFADGPPVSSQIRNVPLFSPTRTQDTNSEEFLPSSLLLRWYAEEVRQRLLVACGRVPSDVYPSTGAHLFRGFIVIENSAVSAVVSAPDGKLGCTR